MKKKEQKKQINKRKTVLAFLPLGARKDSIWDNNGVWMSRSAGSKKKRAALRR